MIQRLRPNAPRYREIADCIEGCFAQHGDSPRGMGWPNEADAITRYRVMLDVIRETTTRPIRLLDFGCGVGHLYEHLRANDSRTIHYCGIDISSRLIDECRRKHPDADFRVVDALAHPDSLPEFDYAVVNGVFTQKCSIEFSEMFDFVRRAISLLYSRSRCGIAFNAMSKHVDWERDDLFHLPLDEIASYVCRNLSRHFVIRNDYGLYEFTTYVYKQPAALRVEG